MHIYNIAGAVCICVYVCVCMWVCVQDDEDVLYTYYSMGVKSVTRITCVKLDCRQFAILRVVKYLNHRTKKNIMIYKRFVEADSISNQYSFQLRLDMETKKKKNVSKFSRTVGQDV